MSHAKNLNRAGIHTVVLPVELFSFFTTIWATSIAVTDSGAGVIPAVMEPMTKPGLAMITFTPLP